MAYPGVMRALPSATMVCRVLLGLDRAQANGTLHLRGEGRVATLAFERGHLVGANIDRRIATSSRQLLEGVTQVCEWEGLALRFVPEPSASWWKLSEPARTRDVALGAMRVAVRSVNASEIRSDLSGMVLRLTEAGEAMVAGVELVSEETATLFWLRRGVAVEEIPTLPGCGLSGYRFAWMLKLLRGAAAKPGGSYPLLLRKRRELRTQASARRLLDLPESADGREARRALRKLVRDLHPDRFGDSVPLALRRASGEVVTALVDAEARIASGAID